MIDVRGRAVAIAEAGAGAPLLYLHGFADIHAAQRDWLPFHERLARDFRIIAPAHPGCADSAEDDSAETIDDLVFRYLEVIDALGLTEFNLVGASVGGWIAAEIAVRAPEKVRSLVLIGATGLYVPNEPIGDLFMMVQAETGSRYDGFRHMLFRSADAPQALAMFPDGGMGADGDSLRYRMFRFASRFGFAPPYFYHPKLRARLHRYRGPALVMAGEHDHLVPRAHAQAYADGLPKAELEIIPEAGNSAIVEQPEDAAARAAAFLR